eukprot:GSMAST32.ASY1.ANO1.1956.1 assembled CDS
MEVGALHSDPVAEVTLENSVFGVPIRRDLVHRVVCWQRANRRQVKSGGLVKVKNRAEVSGGGRKPWKQKGSGRARHGSIRSPIWRGGGKAHGPRQTRVWSQKLNKKIVQLGIKTALAAKWREGNIAVVDEAVMPTRKTSALVKAIEAHGWVGKKGILFVRGTDEVDENFYWASRNIPYLTVISSENCNVYDLLLREQCVVTVSALDELTERLNRRPGLWHSGARSLKSRDEICSAQQLQHSTQTGTEASKILHSKEHEILNDLNTNMVLGSVLQGMKSRFGVETYAEALAVCQKEIENHSDVSESEMLDDNEVGFYEVAQELLSEMRELDVEDEEALKLLAEMQIKNVDNFLDAST